MGLQDRLAALREKHRELDTMVEREMRRPCPDEARVKRLKRQKLQVKDQLAALAPANGGSSASRTTSWRDDDDAPS